MIQTEKPWPARITAFVAALCLAAAACALSVQTAWADPVVSGGITWEYSEDNKTLTIAPAAENECEEGYQSGQMPDYASAKAPWNAYNSDTGVERIVVSEGVLHLGTFMYGTSKKAFGSLKSVSMPESLTSIGNGKYPVVKSNALADLRIPENVTQVGAKSFLNCDNLKSVQLSYGVFATNDGSLSSAFPNSATISRYSLGEGEDDLLWRDRNGEGASWSFYKTYPVNGEAKSNVLVFEGTGSTADYTASQDGSGRAVYQSYTGEDAVQAVVVKDGITRIGNSLFYQMSSVDAWEIADSVKEIGDIAFSGVGLSNLSLFPSVEVIGANAFSGSKFTTLVIPASVKEIGNSAFACPQTLKDISAEKGSQLASVGQQAFSKAAGGIVDLSNCTSLKTLTASNVFGGKAVDKIILPEGLETFGVAALVYNGAGDIGMIVFPSTLSSVTGDISQGLDYLKGITLTHGSSFVLASEDASSLAEALGSKLKALDLVAGQQFDFGGIASTNGFGAEAVLAKTQVLMRFDSAEKPAVYKLASSDADLANVSDNLVDAGDGVWTLSVQASDTGLYAAAITQDQADANAVIAQIKELPGADKLTLSDAEAVKAAQDALEGLSDGAAALVPVAEKAELKVAAATIRALQAEAEAVKAAQGACEAAGVAYDSAKSLKDNIDAAREAVEENVQAAKNAVSEAQEAQAELEVAKEAQAKAESDANAAKAAQAKAESDANAAKAAQAQAEQAQEAAEESASTSLKQSTMTVKANSVKAKAKKKTTVKASKAFTVKNANGKVSYYKVSGNAKIAVSKTGKVTVKKGLKAKSYKVKVLVCDEGSSQYAPATKTVTLKVKVTK